MPFITTEICQQCGRWTCALQLLTKLTVNWRRWARLSHVFGYSRALGILCSSRPHTANRHLGIGKKREVVSLCEKDPLLRHQNAVSKLSFFFSLYSITLFGQAPKCIFRYHNTDNIKPPKTRAHFSLFIVFFCWKINIEIKSSRRI